MDNTEPSSKPWGGTRVRARRHRTIWASDEEYRKVMEYLFRNRANDPREEGTVGL